MDDAGYRLTDAQLQRFLVDGYLVLRPNLPEGLHRRVYERIAAVLEQTGNPYNNLLPEVPELGQVFCHPAVTGALASILGDGYYLNLHRRCHDRTAGTEAQDMHQDSLHNSRYAVDGTRRHHHVRWAMAFYYPQDTDELMGPDRGRAAQPVPQPAAAGRRCDSARRRGRHRRPRALRHLAPRHRVRDRRPGALHGEVPVHPHGGPAAAELAARRGRRRSALAEPRFRRCATGAAGALGASVALASRRGRERPAGGSQRQRGAPGRSTRDGG